MFTCSASNYEQMNIVDVMVHSMLEDPYRGAFQQTEPTPPRQRSTRSGVEAAPGQTTSDPTSAAIAGVDDDGDHGAAPPGDSPENRGLPQFSPPSDDTPGMA